ncbi:MAG: serine/threonine protein kinase [Alphaproteobacteria bacterium]|nr:serine/threonine protein kinase [Alphaproteobacteria bacterium]MCB9794335.1 serine/threonine protein kinase [Alphaproteobacteria bacterium]
MSPETLRRAHELFGELIALSEEQQRHVLDRLTEEDEALAYMLRELLSADSWVDTLHSLVGEDPAALIDDALGALPEQIAGMKVLSELGRGGMGVVYEAQQEVPRRRVALKTLAPLHDSPTLRERLRAELEALARVEHPGVPAVYQLLEHEGQPVLAMELVRGEPIDLLAAGLPPRARLELLYAVTEAIAAAHAQGVVHRDLKPDNVLVGEGRQVKVLDFGIAALEGETPVLAGTPEWAAPEQLSGGAATPATDVHGLGALGWALLVGGPPPAERPLVRPPSLSMPLFSVLERALDPEPERRHPDARALLQDLDALADDRVVSPLRGRPRAHFSAFLRRNRLGLGLLLIALCVPAWVALRGALARRAREADAGEELAQLRDLAARLGPEHPAVTEAFDQFTGDAAHVDTEALHEAWTWARSERGALAAAGMAWVTAPDEARRRSSLEALAERLAAAARWDALEATLALLPPSALPEARLALAMERWDRERARGLTPPEGQLILDRMSEAQPVEAGTLNLLTQDGRMVWISEDRSELLLLQLDDGAREAFSLPGWTLNHLREGPDGAVWAQAVRGDVTEVHRLAPGAHRLERVDSLPSRSATLHLTDIDGDGQLERLHTGGPTAPMAYVAAESGAPTRPLSELDLSSYAVNVRNAVAVDGELWVAARGWGAPGLLRVQGYPERAEVTEWLRLFANDVQVARGPAGPRIFVFGRPAGSLPSPGLSTEGLQRLVEIAPTTPLTVLSDEVLVGDPREFILADLDGDGVDELLFTQEGGPTRWRSGRHEGEGGWWTLPGLSVLGAGQADADPAEELLVKDRLGERAYILGVEGAPPLPRREASPRPTAAPTPELIDAPLQRTWSRLEELASLGLSLETAQLFERLGDRVDSTGTLALIRALRLYPDIEDRARVAAALAARSLPRSAVDDVRRALTEAHDVRALARLEDRPAPSPLTLRSQDRLSAPWRVYAPESIRPAGERGLFELALHGDRGGGLELPLRWDGEFIEIDADLDILELEWATRVVLELVGEDGAVSMALGRGGATNWGQSHVTYACNPRAMHRDSMGPFEPGRMRMRLSLHREAATLRCGFNEDFRTHALVRLPEAGPLTLRLRVETGQHGAGRVLLEQLRLTGAVLPELEGMDLGLAMALGDAEAARALAEGPDPVTAMAARQLLGLPWAQGDPAALREGLRMLLRTQPEVWVPPTAQRYGDDFPELLYQAWRQSITADDPWGMEFGLSPLLRDLPSDSVEGERLAVLRAQALIAHGRMAEAEQALAPLRARDAPDAWRITALIYRERGDDARASEAIQRWLAVTPEPAEALEYGLGDAHFAELLRALMPLPQEIR